MDSSYFARDEDEELLRTFFDPIFDYGVVPSTPVETVGTPRASDDKYDNEEDSACWTNDEQHVLLTYREGKGDPVVITVSDLECLKPKECLSITIFEFYIKYLEKKHESAVGSCYFFSSNFFRQLHESHPPSRDIVLMWTEEVNMFEMDYVFIPVLLRSCWSLIIISHLSSLTSSLRERKMSPCILHLDPIGAHENFKELLISCLLEAAKKVSIATSLALNRGLEYVRPEVPQPAYLSDSGLYVLQYVEFFLSESTSPDFSFTASNKGPHFTSPHFYSEVSSKRESIQRLICDLSRKCQPYTQPRLLKGHNKISTKWSEEENSILLNHMIKGGRKRRRGDGPTHWDLISQEIQTKIGHMRSKNECRRRYDTLLKSYKKLKAIGKPFSAITKEERLKLNLGTVLSEQSYKAIEAIQHKSYKPESQKHAKLISSDGTDMLSLSAHNLPLLPGNSYPKQDIPEFDSLDDDLRSTLLDLIVTLSMKDWSERNNKCFGDPAIFELDVLCQWLAVLQDRDPEDMKEYLDKLEKRKLLNFESVMKYGMVSNLQKCLKLLCKSRIPDLNTSLGILNRKNCDFVSIPIAQFSSPLDRIRVLSLYRCQELELVDLTLFYELRSLAILDCARLQAVTGWEAVKKLGWLEIRNCPGDFPQIPCLPSLRAFCFESSGLWTLPARPCAFSHCVDLRRLEIWEKTAWPVDGLDLSRLMFLEVVTLRNCFGLETIRGLSGLRFLKHLDLGGCVKVRRLPELGCMKAVTHLDLGFSDVRELSGMEELRSLTTLVLQHCLSLKRIPRLANLKALAHLDIGSSGVEDLPGVEDLVALETLYCSKSKLMVLPKLHHLPRLRRVCVGDTPCANDRSSPYFGLSVIDCERDSEVDPLMQYLGFDVVWK